MESYVTVSGAAKILNISGEYVRMLERSGALPAMRTESGVRIFSRQTVESFAKERDRQKKASEKHGANDQKKKTKGARSDR